MRNRQTNFVAKAVPILLAALVLSGCAVGPNYHRPAVQTPPAFHGPDQSQQTESQTASFADLPWWQVFHDPQLQELIRMALKQNHDLQLAAERVTAARAQLGVVRSNEFPQVSLDPTFSGGKSDENIKSNVFSLVADAVFQVDLFGRYRRATEAARAQLMGTKDAQQTVALTLVSDVASDYFLLRDLDLQLQISKDTVRTQEDSVKLTIYALSTVLPQRWTCFRRGKCSTLRMHRSPTSNGKSARPKTRSISSSGSIRTMFLGECLWALKPRRAGRGARLFRRSYLRGFRRNCSSADLISVRPSKTWSPPMPISVWQKRCSFPKSPCSALEARHLDIASLPDRISPPHSGSEPTRQPRRSQSSRAARCETISATPNRKIVKP
jgi:hypothetical protein